MSSHTEPMDPAEVVELAQCFDPIPLAGNWKCLDCGESLSELSPRWRWAGDRWQHSHGYPDSHIDAVKMVKECGS